MGSRRRLLFSTKKCILDGKGAMQVIKLVVTDVDGTIVPKDERLRDEVVAMAQKLRQQGICYTIATGRVASQVQDYVEQLGLGETPYIVCNGGTIVHRGQVVLHRTLPLRPLQPLVAVAEALEMSVLYSVDGVERACRLTDYVRQQQQDFGRYAQVEPFTQSMWEQHQIDKLVVMAKVRDGSLDAVEALCKELPAPFAYRRYANKAIELLHSDATKEKGLETLAQMLGVGMDEVLAVGDDLNDLGMLTAAGIGVAVQNAQPPAKEAADYVAKGECYLGVIEAVERFCFGEEQKN